MPSKPHASERFVRHARTFAIVTLISRFFGLARDVLLTGFLGWNAIGTAFNNAFQFPNTFRRLFGEGALSAAFIPEYAQTMEKDPELAARFASLTIGILTILLGAITVLIELVLGALLLFGNIAPSGQQGYILLMIMLPYMPLVCITALMGGMLQTHARFATQAAAPIVLNICMIAAAFIAGLILRLNGQTIALWISVSVTLAGVLQLLWCLRDLRGRTTWTRAIVGAGEPFRRMARRMGPVVLGLGAMQLCTLFESQFLLQYPLNTGGKPIQFPWMSAPVAYPLDQSSGAMLATAARLYQFPLGVFGIALATAVFPLMSRQASNPAAFVSTLRRSIRLSLFIGMPATIGLIFVRTDLIAALFLKGSQINAQQVPRVAYVLLMYAAAIGAFSLTHVLTRAFYAKGNVRLPTHLAILTVGITVVLDLTLMWPLREAGLALSASIAAAVQCMLLLWFSHSLHPGHATFDRTTLLGIARSLGAALIMLAALTVLSLAWKRPQVGVWSAHVLRLAVDVTVGGVSFMVAAALLCRQEIHWLRDRPAKDSSMPPADVR